MPYQLATPVSSSPIFAVGVFGAAMRACFFPQLAAPMIAINAITKYARTLLEGMNTASRTPKTILLVFVFSENGGVKP